MLYMVIERFKNRDAKAVYRRFREQGRMAPDGFTYVDFDRCFQLMACGEPRLLEEWANHWRDLVEFAFVPVNTSKEAVAIITPQL